MDTQKQRFNVGLDKAGAEYAARSRAADSQSLPCTITALNDTATMVTVKIDLSDAEYPEIEIPVSMCELVRYPLKVGDKGIARNGDIYIGGVSGNGGGVANSAMVGNLAGLVFEPCTSTEWVSVNPDYLTVLTQISDNAFKTTPTRIHDKSADIIAMLKQIISVLNTNSAVTNIHIPSAIPIIVDTLDTVETNLAQEQDA